MSLTLWNKVCATDPKFTKTVAYGKRKFTAIDPTWQVRTATALWGPYGKAWGLRDLKWQIIDTKHEVRQQTLVLGATFFCPESEFEMWVDMDWKPGEDCYKKLRTECQSKSLSLLGFSADVFLGQFDDNQYVSDAKARFGDRDALRQRAILGIKTAKTPEALASCRKRAEQLFADDVIDQEIFEQLIAEIEKRKF